MQVIHISETQKESGYELVNLLANRYSKRNGFLVIECGGEQFLSGGFIIEDTPLNRKVLDSIPRNEQLAFVKSFKQDPYVKQYFDESDEQEIPKEMSKTFTNEQKRNLLKDSNYPSGLGFMKTLRTVLWDLNPNRKKITAFYFALSIGKNLRAAFEDGLNA